MRTRTWRRGTKSWLLPLDTRPKWSTSRVCEEKDGKFGKKECYFEWILDRFCRKCHFEWILANLKFCVQFRHQLAALITQIQHVYNIGKWTAWQRGNDATSLPHMIERGTVQNWEKKGEKIVLDQCVERVGLDWKDQSFGGKMTIERKNEKKNTNFAKKNKTNNF